MTTMTSQPSTSADGEAKAFAPASTSGLVFVVSRFHTPTSCPTAINRSAIDPPIRPVPQTPIFIFGSLGSVPGSVSMIHAKMLRDQLLVVQNFAGLARKDATAGVENDRL